MVIFVQCFDMFISLLVKDNQTWWSWPVRFWNNNWPSESPFLCFCSDKQAFCQLSGRCLFQFHYCSRWISNNFQQHEPYRESPSGGEKDVFPNLKHPVLATVPQTEMLVKQAEDKEIFSPFYVIANSVNTEYVFTFQWLKTN